MPESRRSSPAPWIVAGIAGVIFIALIVVYYSALLPYRRDHTPAQFTSTEQDAITAASTETVNLLSYRRADFDADYARAVNGATGQLKSEVQGNKAKTLKQLTTGKFDLTAKATHEALVGPAEKKEPSKGYVVLVTVNGYKSTQPDAPTQQSLQVTVIKVGGKWLVNDVENIGIS
jgi:hypothetical protein